MTTDLDIDLDLAIAAVPDQRIRQIMAGDIPAMIRATERGITPADLTRHWPRWCVNCESRVPCYCGEGAFPVPAVPLAGSGVHVAVDPIAEAMAEAMAEALLH